jgi:hypothetical protein
MERSTGQNFTSVCEETAFLNGVERFSRESSLESSTLLRR